MLSEDIQLCMIYETLVLSHDGNGSHLWYRAMKEKSSQFHYDMQCHESVKN